ncbi:MAG TPA: TetR family transcriptional regulator [Nitrobacter sp.]|nr:TetR family transcriptional regulator [Nitrobacter sp.]
MRYEKGHKETTRQRIVEVASRQFRARGIDAVGLAAIMADAGLTNGAFYAHFGSKEDLVSDVLTSAQAGRERTLRTKLEHGISLDTAIRDYLSPRHRDNPGGGCPTAALVADVARRPKATRDAYTARIEDFVAVMAARLPAGSDEERRSKAIALYGLMVGTLQLARAVSDRGLSDRILASGVDAALALIGPSVSR